MSNKHKNREGVVYSTNPDFQYTENNGEESEILPAQKQKLKIFTDTKMRAGKTVTVIEGFVGKENDLEALCKMLKTSCGAGGTIKDRLVLIQGDHKNKIIDLIKKKGYSIK